MQTIAPCPSFFVTHFHIFFFNFFIFALFLLFYLLFPFFFLSYRVFIHIFILCFLRFLFSLISLFIFALLAPVFYFVSSCNPSLLLCFAYLPYSFSILLSSFIYFLQYLLPQFLFFFYLSRSINSSYPFTTFCPYLYSYYKDLAIS